MGERIRRQATRLKAATWDADDPNKSRKQWGIRLLVAGLTLLALIVALAIDIPAKGVGAAKVNDLPAIALGQPLVYRAEIFLIVFYGGLLILTPLFRGVIEGQLPIEVSARGAKFAESVVGLSKDTQETIDGLGRQVSEARGDVIKTRLDLGELKAEMEKLRPPEIPGLEAKKE